MGVCTTRHWQTSGRQVQELNGCTVGEPASIAITGDSKADHNGNSHRQPSREQTHLHKNQLAKYNFRKQSIRTVIMMFPRESFINTTAVDKLLPCFVRIRHQFTDS